jgi:hypothetical protein
MNIITDYYSRRGSSESAVESASLSSKDTGNIQVQLNTGTDVSNLLTEELGSFSVDEFAELSKLEKVSGGTGQQDLLLLAFHEENATPIELKNFFDNIDNQLFVDEFRCCLEDEMRIRKIIDKLFTKMTLNLADLARRWIIYCNKISLDFIASIFFIHKISHSPVCYTLRFFGERHPL